MSMNPLDWTVTLAVWPFLWLAVMLPIVIWSAIHEAKKRGDW